MPVFIELPERAMLAGEALFVRLRTLDELDEFWSEFQDKFAFACEGKLSDQPCFLHEYEWVFGVTKAAVVRTVLRWGQSGIECEFYDWANRDPRLHEMFFRDRDAYRDSMIQKGSWSEKDETNYHVDSVRRTAATYRGWWRLCNLPNEYSSDEWLSGCSGHEELIDPHMPYGDVASTLLEQTFDDWRGTDFWELESHDAQSIYRLIQYWKNERAKGESYFGEENEVL